MVDEDQNLIALSPVKSIDSSQKLIADFLNQKGAMGCLVDPTLINYQVEKIIEQKKVYSRKVQERPHTPEIPEHKPATAASPLTTKSPLLRPTEMSTFVTRKSATV